MVLVARQPAGLQYFFASSSGNPYSPGDRDIMPTFSYEAVSSSGERETGSIDSPAKAAALGRLRRRGLKVFEIKEAGASADLPLAAADGRSSAAKPDKNNATHAASTETRLSAGELVRFTEEMADLLNAGFNLEQALQTLARSPGGQTGASAKVTSVAAQVRERIRGGTSFSRALAEASPSFDHLYRNLAMAGDQGGVLGPVLERQAAYLKSIAQLRGKVVTALVYPSILLLAGAGLLGIFVGYLVPKLVVLLKSTGSQSSTGVRLIIDGSLFLNQYWWLLLLVGAVLAVALVGLARSEFARPYRERWQFQIPLAGVVLRGRFQVTYLATMANLVRNGLDLSRALELASSITENHYLSDRLKAMNAAVSGGTRSLSRAMAESGIFDHPAPDIVRVGEETADLSIAFGRAASRFEAELEVKIERVTAMIQPAVLAVLVVVVGAIAYMMLNVIYDSMNSVRMR